MDTTDTAAEIRCADNCGCDVCADARTDLAHEIRHAIRGELDSLLPSDWAKDFNGNVVIDAAVRVAAAREHRTRQYGARLHREMLAAKDAENTDAGRHARRHTVCICGSLNRAAVEIIEATQAEWAKGHWVYAPNLQPTRLLEDIITQHLARILDADEVLVVNPGGYIGESTRNEIAYAEEHGKPVRYLEPLEPVPAVSPVQEPQDHE